MILIAVLLIIGGVFALMSGWMVLGVVLIGLGLLLFLIRVSKGGGIGDAVADIDFPDFD